MKIILALDGGGIRGVVPAVILDYLEKKIQHIQEVKTARIGTFMDLVGGTSTGSIVGSLMLLPCEEKLEFPKYSMEAIMEMYIEMGPDVFKSHFWHNVKTLWGLFGSKFPASNIEPDLLQMLDHYKLKDLVKPCLFNAYDIDKRRVNIYTNHDDKGKYADYYVKDVVRGSTSIPAYFPPAHFNVGVDQNTLVDGGVFANNPAMVSYIEAIKEIKKVKGKGRRKSPHNILVISMGTGASKRKAFPYSKAKRWGMVRWVFPILDVLLSGSSDIVDYEISRLFEAYGASENYIRINPPLHYSTAPSTDASKENITNLLKDASAYIKENQEFLNNLAQRIVDLHT